MIRPVMICSMGPAPKAAAARRAVASGGRGPTNQARPPLKRKSAVPRGLDRKATLTAGGRARTLPPPQNARQAAASTAARRRLGQDQTAASARAYDASSTPVHGRSSTVDQGQAAARRHIFSKSPSPKSASNAAGPAARGTRASSPQSARPAHKRSPASGTSATLASGPTSEALPKVAAKSGHRAAVTARLAPDRTRAPRAARGQCRGAAASRRGAAVNRAAQAEKLISAPGESAASGPQARRAAADRVSAAEVVLCRSSRRAALPADSISQARRLGGSAPAISA